MDINLFPKAELAKQPISAISAYAALKLAVVIDLKLPAPVIFPAPQR